MRLASWTLLNLILCAAAAAAQPTPVAAHFAERRIDVQIERQTFDKALAEFAYQSGLQIARLNNSSVELTLVGPLRGELSLSEALRQLLEPVGYSYRFVDARTIAVIPSNEAAKPSPNIPKPNNASRQVSTPISLEEIIVSARRRIERVQDVPMIVSTLSGDELVSRDIKNAFDMDKAVAGMTLCCSRGGVRYTFMRGVKGVVGYWSEVPVSLSGSAFYFDMDRVQTLKGPQGTLFGLSTNGGAILFEPVRPSDTSGSFASFAMGSSERRTIEGAFTSTLSSTLRVRVGALSHFSEGYIRDLSNGKKYGGEDHVIARVSASWQPSNAFANHAVLNYYRSTTSPNGGLTGGGDSILTGVNPDGRAYAAFGAELDEYLQRQRALGRYTIVGTSLPGGPRSDVEQFNFANIAEARLGDTFTLRTIGGVSAYRANALTDGDNTPLPISGSSEPTVRVRGPTMTYTLEPQLQHIDPDGRFLFVLGSFNSWLRPPQPVPIYAFNVGTRIGTLYRNEETTNAVYAEGTYALTKSVDLTAGYRHTWDDREVMTQNLDGNGLPLGESRVLKGNWDAGSYRIGVTWKPSELAMVYIMHSRGYTSGGFNTGIWPPEVQRYEPESLRNFEVGLKADWLLGNMQARASLAVFSGEYDNVQVYVPWTMTNPQTGLVASGLPLMNAAEGVASGAELEFTLLPTPSFELSGGVTYTHTRYTQYEGRDPRDPTGATTVDMRSLPFLYAPRWKYTVRMQWQVPIDEALGGLLIGADYGWQDRVANDARLFSTNPYAWNPPIHNLGAHVTWANPFGWEGLTASLLGTNLTNFDRMNAQFNAYHTSGFFGWGAAPPRAWALRVRYDF